MPCGQQALTALALVFYELATNAAKYGALATDDGQIAVTWMLEGETLAIHWQERGGPAGVQPKSSGFGSLLLRDTVTGQLGGTLHHDWGTEGLTVTVTVPVARLRD